MIITKDNYPHQYEKLESAFHSGSITEMKNAQQEVRNHFARPVQAPQDIHEYMDRYLYNVRQGSSPSYHLVFMRYKDDNGEAYWKEEYAPEMFDDFR